MTRRKLWTATVESNGGTLAAQCKGSRHELLQRLRADDPVWSRDSVRLEIRKRMPKRSFRQGLAIDFVRGPFRCLGMAVALEIDGLALDFASGHDKVRKYIPRMQWAGAADADGARQALSVSFIRCVRDAAAHFLVTQEGLTPAQAALVVAGPVNGFEARMCLEVLVPFMRSQQGLGVGLMQYVPLPDAGLTDSRIAG